ncbi:TIR domain-containing protein [Henriciella litoralis]|uniref:TIR domain-containing protein n=1 Tax=Henriciella litoralis TaxID=568102 RepID=UPI000A0324E8|nr:TIR domain-containing protein [Henriciella litoralis]
MKCFLSHSSKDKLSYASIVANALKPNVEYDEYTFEEGMENFEEILRALERSSVFVLLISDHSLNSEWVRREISEAQHRLSTGDLKRFFPIIIDPNIAHTDPRIPDWIQTAYNLRPITRPTIAAKRIKERLVEVSWQTHPMLKKRDQIFVGRNAQLQEFEQRFDDVTRRQPIAVFASGLHEIGRKTTIIHALRKANVVRSTYEPIRLDLNRDDNIEGFIVKLYDLAISETKDIENLLSKSVEEKTRICAVLLNDIAAQKEIIVIDDNYCIVRFEGEIAPWFESVLSHLKSDKVLLCIASSARPLKYKYRKDELFFISVPELDKTESVGLFKRYTEILGINLSEKEYENFLPLLKGFPEQVTYAASLISDLGTEKALQNSHDIANFSIYRANIVIRHFENDPDLVDFLRFISSFEFVSIDFISKIGILIQKSITDYIDILLQHNVCEIIGPNGNYFRVNEVIRDAIIRDRYEIRDDYASALKDFAEEFVKSSPEEVFDVSEYQIAIKEALASDTPVPHQKLIPAHFLQTMRQLYGDRNYLEVIRLADRVLLNKDNFDNHTEQDIRYYLCQSLARRTSDRFLTEVQKISGPEHDFLLGFYYRLKRRFPKALQRYHAAMKHRRTEQRARREIVFVLLTTEDYDAAISLARENFERYPHNPYLAQAFFNCAINNRDKERAKLETSEILEALTKIGGDRATEMAASLQARFEFEFGDKVIAFEKVDSVIKAYPDIIYPRLTKLEMATAYEDLALLKDTISELKSQNLGAGHRSAITKAEAVVLSLSGDKDRALRMLDRELSDLSDTAKERLRRRIERTLN